MEMVLNNLFVEMTEADMVILDAGGLLDWSAAIGGLYTAAVGVTEFLGTTSLACAGTCAAIASAPVVAGSAAVVGVACAGYGLYQAVKN